MGWLYEQACALDNADAMHNLATMYRTGESVEKNTQKAFNLYQHASKLGHSNARYQLALMYQYGNGVKKDIPQAIITLASKSY